MASETLIRRMFPDRPTGSLAVPPLLCIPTGGIGRHDASRAEKFRLKQPGLSANMRSENQSFLQADPKIQPGT